eukprot:8515441-Alexandrium_andersonii.AAC.1
MQPFCRAPSPQKITDMRNTAVTQASMSQGVHPSECMAVRTDVQSSATVHQRTTKACTRATPTPCASRTAHRTGALACTAGGRSRPR